MDLGAIAVRETFASSLELGREVMIALGMDSQLAEERANRFREHDERVLAAQHLVYDDEDALRQTAKDARAELEQLFETDRGEGVLGQVGGKGVQ